MSEPDTTNKTNLDLEQNPEQESEQTESRVLLSTAQETNPQGDKYPKTPKVPDEEFLASAQCLNQNYTWLSCSKVFCPPWRRCIGGQCICKMPYKCPRQQINACTLEGSVYYSMCQANAISCRSKKATFSHFSQTCK
ncbi:hypothetical protein M9458_054635, partial [Cirrhinus mrigala]